jgi:phosphoesterase RecJ-like protein
VSNVFSVPELEEVKTLLSSSKKIIITTHRSPDGDAIGSSLALCHYLVSKGHDAKVVVPDSYPKFLQWMPGNDGVLVYDYHKEISERKIEAADIIFSLDYNGLGRIMDLAKPVAAAKGTKIIIDHHQQPEDFADYTFSDTDSCSTAQLVYEFIEALGDADAINADMANCLYVGIMTDTGSFRFPSTLSKTHRIVASLIDCGAKNSQIHEWVYDTNTLSQLQLLGYALSNKLELLEEYNVAIISLTQEELIRFSFKKGDTEGLVNYALSIDGVRVAAFFAEKDGLVRISFRSKGAFSVNQFARKHFNGGGHDRAAGGASEKSIAETLTEFKGLLVQYKQELTS